MRASHSRVIGMVLTVLCCKAAEVCVALWLLLVIEFYIHENHSLYVPHCSESFTVLRHHKAQMRTHHRKEQMIVPSALHNSVQDTVYMCN